MTNSNDQINFAKSVLAQMESLGMVGQFVESFESDDGMAVKMVEAGAAQAIRKFENMEIQLLTRPEAKQMFIDSVYDKLAA